MKIASIILSSVTILMTLSQLICGLWVKSHGSEPSSITFHTQLGIGTVIMTVITLVVLLIYLFRG